MFPIKWVNNPKLGDSCFTMLGEKCSSAGERAEPWRINKCTWGGGLVLLLLLLFCLCAPSLQVFNPVHTLSLLFPLFFCFSFSLASPLSVSLSFLLLVGVGGVLVRGKGKEAELIDGANYRPLAACCLHPQIRLKPKLISLATWPDQVGGCSVPSGPSHFKPQHSLSPSTAAAAGLFFRMCRVSPPAQDRKVLKWGWSCSRRIRGGVYVCGGSEPKLLSGLQSDPVKIRCEQRL